MPHLSKSTLSRYIGSECRRQLRLALSPDNARFRHEREAAGMPDRHPPRPGLEQIAQAGETWQAAKLEDLAATFGPAALVGAPETVDGRTRYRALPLAQALGRAAPFAFLVETEFDVGPAFLDALGAASLRTAHGLEYAHLRPDLIEVLPAGTHDRAIDARGDVAPLASDDPRAQLRVIDIKLTAEPSAAYFTEVTYYAMALAGWLADRGLADRYVVVPDAAVWPGTHAAARLVTENQRLRKAGEVPTAAQLRAAMQADLEVVPFEAFAYRIRRFFAQDLPAVLATPWRDLPWHVDNRCRHCDYLGFPWKGEDAQGTADPDHCYPMAMFESHLSRVAFLSRGASEALQASGVRDVADLAARPGEDPVFDAHHLLRATRAVVAGRAQALEANTALVPPSSGTSAVMPRWTDLRVYLSADFDAGSAITLAFGLKAFWLEHRAYGDANPAPRVTKAWEPEVFLVDLKDLEVERRELLGLLARLRALLEWAKAQHPETSFQVYLWDALQFKHLCRVVGRHLEAILAEQSLAHLAWLFPPETLLPDPKTASRASPITIVREAIRSVLAAPIAHYYSLLSVARVYHHEATPPGVARFHVHPLFEDPLSDQIPPERAHEIWSRSNTRQPWLQQATVLQETVARRLEALESVTRRLEDGLRPTLRQKAPTIDVGPPRREDGVSVDGQLWYGFAKLNAALAELEVQQVRAMPAYEREARFHTARLPRRLPPGEAGAVLTNLGLYPAPHRVVYELGPGSREVRLREGDFQCALAPESAPGLLDQNLYGYLAQSPFPSTDKALMQSKVEALTAVTVAGIDRDRGHVAVDLSPRWLPLLQKLEASEHLDLAKDVVLERTHRDFFTRRLKEVLKSIGNPAVASASPLVYRATGQSPPKRAGRRTRPTPVADLLWNARALFDGAVPRELGPVRAALEAGGVSLNASQWRAWTEALTRRVRLIWGPPGTGKSSTLRAIVLGAVLDAHRRGRDLRLLVAAPTYNALDNVLLAFAGAARHPLLPAAVVVRRLRSAAQSAPDALRDDEDVPLDRTTGPSKGQDLRARLRAGRGITLVGGTAEQVSKLLALGQEEPVQPFFDLVLIDEASQMDVAHAILALAGLAPDGGVVVAGDPKQLPPIHPAEPPVGLEAMVGSVYEFFAKIHGVPAVMLEENYRSNAAIVGFCRRAGYRDTLRSWSPDLTLDLRSPLPTERPPDWPEALHWTPGWSALLDPARPAACFVYPDERASQWNRFEADAVAALLWLLHGRLGRSLANERRAPDGAPLPVVPEPCSPRAFWRRAVGVVTPHRAQQSLIVQRLQQLFAPTLVPQGEIRDAVDTVERFQGQQRDVIVASFALGDPDLIGDEDEFLMSLNRFNVMVSRARAKVVVLLAESVVRHLSDDVATLRASQLLKGFVESFCAEASPLALGHRVGGEDRVVCGTLRRCPV